MKSMKRLNVFPINVLTIMLCVGVILVNGTVSTSQGIAGIRLPRTGAQLVGTVLRNCNNMQCVKTNVLGFLDSILNIRSDPRSIENIDQAIFKRAAKILNTHEIRLRLPRMIFGQSDLVYNPAYGFNVQSPEDNSDSERGLGLKKKLLFPVLLLLKLKLKALMPIFVALIGIKAMKALILSKLAIVIVIGFVAYQLLGKGGMASPMMTMTPIEPPPPMYGAPPATTSPPVNSYEPGWEPSNGNGGGPYARIWNAGGSASAAESAHNLAYSGYYPSSTNRP